MQSRIAASTFVWRAMMPARSRPSWSSTEPLAAAGLSESDFSSSPPPHAASPSAAVSARTVADARSVFAFNIESPP
jgi:hypothetical protein